MRLVLATAQGGPHEKYICLSHCWGQAKTLKTTKTSLSEHLRLIKWRRIPSTYRETIAVARFLGVRYVWIDSLCIVQDDEDDWVRESQAMAGIYQNAYLTVVASSSRDANGGLFPRARGRERYVTGTRAGGEAYSFIATDALDVAHPAPASHTGGLQDNWPALTRAWIFQERLLSPRVVHFAHPEMMWECNGGPPHCECGGLRDRLHKGSYTAALQDGSAGELDRVWRGVVEGYSGLSLTYPKDKLPALSGVARQMASRRPGATYLAGLWSDSLEDDLFWVQRDAQDPSKWRRTRPDAWRAPSWSWASVDGPVLFPMNDTSQGEVRRLFRVESGRCSLASSDPTGQVADGTIVVHGSLDEGRLSMEHSCFRVQLGHDSHSYSSNFRHGSRRLYLDDQLDPSGRGELVLSDVPATTTVPVKCLRMALQIRTHSLVQYSMVLYRTEDGVYKRIGMLRRYEETTRSRRPMRVKEEAVDLFEMFFCPETVTGFIEKQDRLEAARRDIEREDQWDVAALPASPELLDTITIR